MNAKSEWQRIYMEPTMRLMRAAFWRTTVVGPPPGTPDLGAALEEFVALMDREPDGARTALIYLGNMAGRGLLDSAVEGGYLRIGGDQPVTRAHALDALAIEYLASLFDPLPDHPPEPPNPVP